MIRFLLIALVLIAFLILFIPILGIEWIIGKFNKRAMQISSLRMVQAIFKLIIFLSGVNLHVKGEENIPKNEPVLYIGNHNSYFDIVITYSRCKNLTGYIAKNSMESIPLLSLWMKRLNCLFINREEPREALKTILKGIEYIKNGISIFIYPEGTRNTTDELMLPFKEGSLKMAEKTGCPIIPVAMTNTANIFEKHIPFIKAVNVTLEYGKPIYPNELSKEEKKFLGAYTQNIIKDMLNNADF